MNLFPYDPQLWGRICFGGEGDNLEPQPSPTNAQEALEMMPLGTRFRVLVREVPASDLPLWALQITDASQDERLTGDRELYPSLWVRFDGTTQRSDLSSYTHLLSYCTLEIAPRATRQNVDVVVLVTPRSQPLAAHELPLVMRRV